MSDLSGALHEAADALEAAVADADADADANADAVPGAALQRLLAAAVRLYAARREAGGVDSPFPDPALAAAPAPNATDVCLTATDMLDAVSVEVFELAMWKTWNAMPGGDAQRLT